MISPMALFIGTTVKRSKYRAARQLVRSRRSNRIVHACQSACVRKSSSRAAVISFAVSLLAHAIGAAAALEAVAGAPQFRMASTWAGLIRLLRRACEHRNSSRSLLAPATRRLARVHTQGADQADVCSKMCQKQKVPKGALVDDVPTPEELQPLFTPFKLGPFELKKRIVYAPLTRNRALGHVPAAAAATYYSQRAQDGQLVISEGTIVDYGGYGYPNIPGIHTDEQIEAWKPIVKAVHAKKAIFFCQIWHVGRGVIAAYNKDGAPPVGPSAVVMEPDQKVFHPETFEAMPPEMPRALGKDELPGLAQAFARAAVNATEKCGFNGVEIHSANGYLLDSFLKTTANKRTDEYGGSIENRARFVLEVVDAVIAAVGADRVGLRLSPFNKTFMSAESEDPYEEAYVVEQLSNRGLAYVHLVEPRVHGDGATGLHETQDSLAPFRKVCKVPFIVAGGYKKESALEAITSGAADLVTMGRWALANPDLLLRFKLDAPLTKYDRPTFYIPDPVKGYTDYPFLEDSPEGKEYYAE